MGLSGISFPPPVGAGDRVGVAALSGPVDAGRLERGLEALAALGFEPVPADNLARRHQLFAGDDGERLAAFHRLAADDSLAAIVFARGGHGVLRLLPQIDWALLARRPRAYVGYSDLTPFLHQVVGRLQLVAFHGPMVAADLARGLSPAEERSLLDALAGRRPLAFPLAGWRRRGGGEGPLLGGCLSMLVSTLGTPYFPDLDGALLLLEDVGEPLYRLDRMLVQLRLAGALDALAGLALGRFDLARGQDPELLPRLVDEVLAGLPWPLAHGLDCGHSPPNLTFPLGAPARLDTALGALVVGVK